MMNNLSGSTDRLHFVQCLARERHGQVRQSLDRATPGGGGPLHHLFDFIGLSYASVVRLTVLSKAATLRWRLARAGSATLSAYLTHHTTLGDR